uniref:Putative secreted protein n=1 Tax=Anopheles darlingi TaxID=43151 RepID=A0A2M4DFI7_ANODA
MCRYTAYTGTVLATMVRAVLLERATGRNGTQFCVRHGIHALCVIELIVSKPLTDKSRRIVRIRLRSPWELLAR